jgi:hypothetical protein
LFSRDAEFVDGGLLLIFWFKIAWLLIFCRGTCEILSFFTVDFSCFYPFGTEVFPCLLRFPIKFTLSMSLGFKVLFFYLRFSFPSSGDIIFCPLAELYLVLLFLFTLLLLCFLLTLCVS